MAKTLRASVAPWEAGVDVQKVSKLPNGDLRLEVKEMKKGGAAIFAKAVEEKVGAPAVVADRRDMMTLVARDLDESTTPEELRGAIEKSSGILARGVDIIVEGPRQGRGGQWSATIRIPRQDGRILVDRKRLNIGGNGWMQCRVAEWVQPDRCYNCQRFGHKAMHCKEERKDRTNQCFRCAKEGHLAKDCRAEAPSCYVCNQAHPANSMACPAFRACVEKEKGGTAKAALPRRTGRTTAEGGGWYMVAQKGGQTKTPTETDAQTVANKKSPSQTGVGGEVETTEGEHQPDDDQNPPNKP
jgi:hypothetical protein